MRRNHSGRVLDSTVIILRVRLGIIETWNFRIQAGRLTVPFQPPVQAEKQPPLPWNDSET